jgi:phosphoribosylformylglycinamidine cyclo-ligase
VKQSLAALNAGGVHALTHITGGGLSENIPRALDDGQGISIDLNTWDLPPVFQWLMAQGGMEQAEMLKTFNCGLGMVLIVDPAQEASVIQCLTDMGEDPVTIGQVTDNAGVHYTGTLS